MISLQTFEKSHESTDLREQATFYPDQFFSGFVARWLIPGMMEFQSGTLALVLPSAALSLRALMI
jgi:hypothetical protein